MFVTYLDYLLKQNSLLQYKLFAFADDLVFMAKNLTELCDIINKLNKLCPSLTMNFEKSGVVPIGSNKLDNQKTFKTIPIVFSYKYLGC